MHDPRLGASRCYEGDNGWKKYDEQFRLRQSVDTSISWSKIDYELWLMFMQHSTQPRTITSLTTATHNKYYNFNFKGSCDRLGCQYMHKCIRFGEGHPQYSCPDQVLAFKPKGGPIHHSLDLQDRVVPVFSLPSSSLTHFSKLFDPKDLWALGRTPIKVQNLSKYLDEYPDVRAACFLRNGFAKGFQLNYTGPRLHVTS